MQTAHSTFTRGSLDRDIIDLRIGAMGAAPGFLLRRSPCPLGIGLMNGGTNRRWFEETWRSNGSGRFDGFSQN